MFRWILVAASVVFCIAPATRSAELDLDGQLRVRSEGADRSQAGQDVLWDILQRVRVGLRATVSEEVDLYIQVQDSRTYGSEPSTLTSTINLDLHQGWAEVRKPWGDAELQVRLGRQELSYGNERIVGAVGWNNVGRAFDGLRTRIPRGQWRFDLGAWRLRDEQGAPETPTYVDSNLPRWNDDLYMTYNSYAAAAGQFHGDLYGLYRNDRRGFYETTIGEHIDGKWRWLRYDHEFTAQLGKRLGEDLEAYLFSAQAHASVGNGFECGAGFDFLSGDETPGDGTFNYFDTTRIFHTGHKFYGRLDSPFILTPAGLLNPYGSIGFKGPRNLSATAVVHGFFTHRDFVQSNTGGTPTNQSYMGTEVDAWVGLSVAARTRLEVGGAVLVPGRVLKDRSLEETAVWAYAQGVASF